MTENRRITDKLPTQSLEWNTDRKLIDAALHHLDTERIASTIVYVPDTDPQLYVAAGTKDALRGLLRDETAPDTETLAGQDWKAPATPAAAPAAGRAGLAELGKRIANHESCGWKMIAVPVREARAMLDYIAQLEQAQAGSALRTDSEAAGQAGLAKLNEADFMAIWNELGGDDKWLKSFGYCQFGFAVQDAINTLAAPVAADTEQATIDTLEFRKLLRAHREAFNAVDPDSDDPIDLPLKAAWDALIAYIDSVKLAPIATPADTEQVNWHKALHELRMAVSYRAACIIEGNQNKIAFADEKLWAAHEKAGEVLATPATTEQATKVPEGWVLVPAHPDQFMINAFITEYERRGGSESGCYRAMLAAAPKPPLATPADAGAGLTDERIDDMARPFAGLGGIGDYRSFARAIEREVLARMSTPKIARPAMTDDEIDQIYKEVYAGEQGLALVKRAVRAAEGRIIARMSTSAAPVTAEPVQSIDTPEFRAKLDAWAQTDCDNVAATAELISYIDSKIAAPADRDAIRNEVLEEAARACEAQAGEPECPERASYCAEAARALKSMERAADAKGGAA